MHGILRARKRTISAQEFQLPQLYFELLNVSKTHY